MVVARKCRHSNNLLTPSIDSVYYRYMKTSLILCHILLYVRFYLFKKVRSRLFLTQEFLQKLILEWKTVGRRTTKKKIYCVDREVSGYFRQSGKHCIFRGTQIGSDEVVNNFENKSCSLNTNVISLFCNKYTTSNFFPNIEFLRISAW